MDKRGENFYKRNDGCREGRYQTYKDGIKKYITVYDKTYMRVKEKLLLARQNAVLNPDTGKLPDCNLTAANLFAKWLREKAALIKPSSYIRYKGLLDIHLLSALGSCPINKLMVQKIAGFCSRSCKASVWIKRADFLLRPLRVYYA